MAVPHTGQGYVKATGATDGGSAMEMGAIGAALAVV